MSRDARISLVWAGDERVFRLAIGEALSLEQNRDSGLAEILARLSGPGWRIADIRETLRLGLIGGGMEGARARTLVEDNVRPGQLAEHVLYARAVLMAAIVGNPGEKVGKTKAATDAAGPEGFPPPPSMEPAPPSDSGPPPSTG